MKSVKSPNQIFWAMEYWFKALQCQIWSTNTKLFFWKSQVNLEIFQKLSSHIGVPYKLVLGSVKGIHRIFCSELLNIWKRLKHAKFGQWIKNHFYGKARQTLKLSKKFAPNLEFHINLFWSLTKAYIKPSEPLNISARLKKETEIL